MTYPIQDHIHLDLPDNLGGTPEFAPLQTFKVIQRTPNYNFTADFSRSWTGRPFFSSVVDSQGDPTFFKGMQYTVKVDESGVKILEGLALHHVLLVDNFHPADGTSHTAAIQHMRLFEIKYGSGIDPKLEIQELSILLLPEESEYAT